METMHPAPSRSLRRSSPRYLVLWVVSLICTSQDLFCISQVMGQPPIDSGFLEPIPETPARRSGTRVPKVSRAPDPLAPMPIAPIGGPFPTAPPPAAAVLPPTLNTASGYNVHVVASEDLLNRFVARIETEPGRVDDFIFGAKVDGEQQTTTRIRVDLVPMVEKAHALFVLEGQAQSRTVGRTEQGTVQSIGQQQFVATKDVFFDGNEFSTRHAVVSVRAHNQNVGASTRLDGTPLESLGHRVALRMAERQRPQSEEYARNRVADKVYPAFDGEVDRQLADANQRIDQDLRRNLQRANLLPAQQLATTTHHYLHYAARIGDDPALVSTAAPGTVLAGSHGLTLYLHESFPNALIERLNLKGKRTTDRELRSLGENFRKETGGSAIRGNETAEPAFQKLETEIIFDEHRPLQLSFDRNYVTVEIRAAFRPAGQQLLPPLVIRMPFRATEQDGFWKLGLGEIAIESSTGEDVPALAKTLIRQALVSDLPETSFPRELSPANWPADKPKLHLSAMRALDGWLAVSLD